MQVITSTELKNVHTPNVYLRFIVRIEGLTMPNCPDVDQIKKAWSLKREGGISQQAMAEELGLHPRTIFNYFRSTCSLNESLAA